jgi:hypothetical protein
MSICTVNGSEHKAGSGLETWGQLLATLEQGDGANRPVVTAVRFAGVDQPTFRAPSVLALDLHAAAPVDVETFLAGELVASARQAVLEGLDTLTAAARDAADAFRLHDLPRAHRGLGNFVTTFRLLTALTDAVGHADVPAAEAEFDQRDAAFLKQLGASLESLVAFNENEDWISVADVLEYEIANVLPQWAAVLNRPEGNAS